MPQQPEAGKRFCLFHKQNRSAVPHPDNLLSAPGSDHDHPEGPAAFRVVLS